MAIRNDNLGSYTDWSDGEVLYSADLNDTNDAIISAGTPLGGIVSMIPQMGVMSLGETDASSADSHLTDTSADFIADNEVWDKLYLIYNESTLVTDSGVKTLVDIVYGNNGGRGVLIKNFNYDGRSGTASTSYNVTFRATFYYTDGTTHSASYYNSNGVWSTRVVENIYPDKEVYEIILSTTSTNYQYNYKNLSIDFLRNDLYITNINSTTDITINRALNFSAGSKYMFHKPMSSLATTSETEGFVTSSATPNLIEDTAATFLTDNVPTGAVVESYVKDTTEHDMTGTSYVLATTLTLGSSPSDGLYIKGAKTEMKGSSSATSAQSFYVQAIFTYTDGTTESIVFSNKAITTYYEQKFENTQTFKKVYKVDFYQKTYYSNYNRCRIRNSTIYYDTDLNLNVFPLVTAVNNETSITISKNIIYDSKFTYKIIWQTNGGNYYICDGSTICANGSALKGRLTPDLTNKFIRASGTPGSTDGVDSHTHQITPVYATVSSGSTANVAHHGEFTSGEADNIPVHYRVVMAMRVV